MLEEKLVKGKIKLLGRLTVNIKFCYNPNMNSDVTTFCNHAGVFSSLSNALQWHPIVVKSRQRLHARASPALCNTMQRHPIVVESRQGFLHQSKRARANKLG